MIPTKKSSEVLILFQYFFKRRYSKIKIIDITHPLIILKGIIPDKIITFKLVNTSPRLNIMPYKGSKTK